MPTTYDETKFVLLKGLKATATRAKAASDAAQALAASAFHSASVANNTVSFFTSTDGSGTAAFTFDFPAELVLDQLKTTPVANFAWDSTTYAGSTNPNLDGKPVLVIAVKEINGGIVTTTYSFLNMEYLVDIYTAADNSININGYNVSVKISAATGNHLALGADGLMVDVSDKADKVANATAGNIASLNASGNLEDSGHGVATDAEITAMPDEVFGAQA